MERIIFDYSKLKGLIIEKYNSQNAFAKALGITNTALSNKLNNHQCFTQKMIIEIADLLNIKNIDDYFFKRVV